LRPGSFAALCCIGVGLFVLMIVGLAGCTITTPNAGEIGVVRNGGPFDNHNIRQVISNGSGNTWAGWFSDVHYYPVASQQRYFRMESCYDGDNEVPCDGADSIAVTVPTADGVDVSIEGTTYLNTVFDNTPSGDQALKAFDTQFATRTFGGKHAYEGNDGWSNFLSINVEPVVANNLRETIAGVTCAELVSSCALVQNQGKASPTDLKTKNNAQNVSQIQNQVQRNLKTDMYRTLGRTYFRNFRFTLKRVVLPEKVQSAIDTAQAAFADVSQAEAKVKAAQKEGEANAAREQGYKNCPTCAKIDARRALPRDLKALGGNTVLGLEP
jgi:hypothetical protein